MSKLILGLDLGSNSLGWALLNADDENRPISILDTGVRIFPKAVEEKTPTPKNQQRRNSRLARRTIQRRARRKQRLENYLIKLGLLPSELQQENREGILNGLGDPYQLRAKALDYQLTAHELGRVLLHLVQRRGFLSNKKTLLGREMLDDPDVIAVLQEEDGEETSIDSEESAFKADISKLRKTIHNSGFRTLGEYLASLPIHECKRNRDGQHLRTDRQMYQEELTLIFKQQSKYHAVLNEEAQEQIEHIIFHQRPLKLKKDRVGKCSLEPRNKRAAIARLEYQRFRYLQDINNLRYLNHYTNQEEALNQIDREKLAKFFEQEETISFAKVREILGLDKKTEFNLESGVKKLKGNTTSSSIQKVYPDWNNLNSVDQYELVEDLISIKKKSTLKNRLINHWQLSAETAVRLCMLELEPDHGHHSLKAIRKILPYLEKGQLYSDARISAGYGYDKKAIKAVEKLGPPPSIANPIVNKGLHELKRVINALIAEYGKPDVIRIEMARDLEMNSKRYKSYISQQNKNTKANDQAIEAYQDEMKKHPSIGSSKYPSHDQKVRYRLWVDQNYCCAYSGQPISRGALFSADVEVDHIIPYSQSLDDSYMNKVVCFAEENQIKGQRTPLNAFGNNEEKWNQITHTIGNWSKFLSSKRNRFYMQSSDLEKDFISSQLNDTRYISKEAGNYLKTLGCEVTYTRGQMTSWLRHQWQLNDLLSGTSQKDRTDHRHHAIDAVVTACIDRAFYNSLVKQARSIERENSQLTMNDLYFEPQIPDIKEQLKDNLDRMIVSHRPNRKITGALHEETGVGFIEGVGTVYRKRLSSDFTIKNANSIIDETVRERVIAHIEKHGSSKAAFAEGFRLYHKDGKTLIKRVRVLQSKATKVKLSENKFAITDQCDNAFKWHAYGNTHHVEIFRHTTKEGKFDTDFVPAMEAQKRVNSKQAIINKVHSSSDYVFLMALHVNDLVTIQIEGKEKIYRVQKLDMVNSKIAIRLQTAANLKNRCEGMEKSAISLIKDFKMRPIKVNAIGKVLTDHDQTHHRHQRSSLPPRSPQTTPC